jgi:predicted dienelactone hydrolase
MSRVATHCKTHPRQFACGIARGRIEATGGIPSDPPIATPTAPHRYPLKAIVIAAPALGFTFSGGLADVQIPVQLWRADRDEILPEPHYADAVRSALPRRAEFHAVPGAGHYDFLAPCSEQLRKIAPQICRSAPGFDRSAFHEEFNASVVGFFARELDAPAEATAPKP